MKKIKNLKVSINRTIKEDFNEFVFLVNFTKELPDFDNKKTVSNEEINELFSLLNQTTQFYFNNKKIKTEEYLKYCGDYIFNHFLPNGLKTLFLKNVTKNVYVNFSIDTLLSPIPWHILYFNNNFLFEQNLVTIVHKGSHQSNKVCDKNNPKILLIYDKTLQESNKECEIIYTIFQKYSPEMVSTSSVSRHELLSLIKNADIVHYSGHTTYYGDNEKEIGFKLSGNEFVTIENIRKEKNKMPYFFFSNSCASAKSEWKNNVTLSSTTLYSASIADTLHKSGTHFFIGTYWPIVDKVNTAFISTFYNSLLKNKMNVSKSFFIAKKQLNVIEQAAYTLFVTPDSKPPDMPITFYKKIISILLLIIIIVVFIHFFFPDTFVSHNQFYNLRTKLSSINTLETELNTLLSQKKSNAHNQKIVLVLEELIKRGKHKNKIWYRKKIILTYSSLKKYDEALHHCILLRDSKISNEQRWAVNMISILENKK